MAAINMCMFIKYISKLLHVFHIVKKTNDVIK